jgi:H+/gluconate symporter-like permease
MTDYLNWADLKTVIIGLITGIIGFFICVGIQRYWSNRSIKSMKRRIEQNEAYKANVNNLAKSDRALLIYGLQGLFAVLCLMACIFFMQVAFAIGRAGRLVDELDLVLMFLWLMVGIACVGVIVVLRDVSKYPESIDNIEKRITKLKNKLLGR